MSSTMRARHYSSGFTLMEILIVMVIIGIVATLGLGSFQSSQQKGRDAKRKEELKQIGVALEAYYNDKGEYPLGSGGQIMGCDGEQACEWGTQFSDENDTVYMVELPEDPKTGREYYYESSDGRSYQIYARLENVLDSVVPVDGDDDPQVYDVSCGDDDCNFGVSSANTTPEEGRTLEAD